MSHRPAKGLLIGVGLGACLLAALGHCADRKAVSCHIHPPGSTPDRPIGIVGPFPSAADCEVERGRRFSGGGRCHCQADFSPPWLPPMPDPGPGGPGGLL